MLAAGIYLRAMREQYYSGRSELAAKLGVDHTKIERLEKGQHDSGWSFVFALIDAVRGNPIDVMRLLLDDTADEKKAREMARDWIERTKHLSLEEQEERQGQAFKLIDELLSDPQKLDQWVDYGEWLRGRGETQ